MIKTNTLVRITYRDKQMMTDTLKMVKTPPMVDSPQKTYYKPPKTSLLSSLASQYGSTYEHEDQHWGKMYTSFVHLNASWCILLSFKLLLPFMSVNYISSYF